MEIELERNPPLSDVWQLFHEYAASLGFALDFQGFDEELATLPGAYTPPRGALLLALCDGEPAGCVALRPLDDESGEVKRLYVRDEFRGHKVGRLLVAELIAVARDAGYRRLRLDTVPAMAAAQALYRSFGFQEIEPYGHHPIPGTLFFELTL